MEKVKKEPWRVVAAACIICAGVAFIVGLYAIGLTSKSASERDFIEYWAAGQEFIHGRNPYDPKALFQLERAAGWDKDYPQVTLSPPIVLLLAWPLGHVSPKTGLILWLIASLGCIVASVGILWLLNGKPESRMHLVGIAFPPALACLMAAQLGDFFLFEAALFLWLHKTRPWLAGAALVLFALKPHLFIPCFLVLLLWSIARKDFRVLAGFLAALATCCGIVTLIDPQAWHQYRQMLLLTQISDLFVPTVAVGFRYLIDPRAAWLQYVPELAGCIWAAWYFWSRRDRWNWLDQGLLVILVSVACASYGWYYDQALLFPAVLVGLYRAERNAPSLILFLVIAVAGLVGIFGNIQAPSPFFIWTAPAWLFWYLFAARIRPTESVVSELTASAG